MHDTDVCLWICHYNKVSKAIQFKPWMMMLTFMLIVSSSNDQHILYHSCYVRLLSFQS